MENHCYLITSWQTSQIIHDQNLEVFWLAPSGGSLRWSCPWLSVPARVRFFWNETGDDFPELSLGINHKSG